MLVRITRWHMEKPPTARAASGWVWVEECVSDNAAELGYVDNAVALAVVFETVDYFYAGRRVEEVGCANLYGCSSGHYELKSIAGVGYAAEANHGNAYSLRHLPYHPYGHRSNGRSRQSSGDC